MVRQTGETPGPETIVPVTAPEWRWLFLAVMVGAALRLAFLNRVAVDHYDEAIYASNVYFGAEEGFQFPGRQYNAPPLMPLLVEITHIVWGLSGLSRPLWLPAIPGLLCGIATIPSAWWIARQWFGPGAGSAAMWLVALNELHAAYSRTALTDVPVTLAILWAVYASWKLLLDPCLKHGAIVGVLTAIAWWLKYSGWLPLAILLVGGAVYQGMIRAEDRRWKPWFIATLTAALIAGMLWFPVIEDCRSVGGYAAVAANHRTYIQSWSSWGTDLLTYLRQYGYYRAWTTLGLVWVLIPQSLPLTGTGPASRLMAGLIVLPLLGGTLLPELLLALLLIAAVWSIADGLIAWARSELRREEVAAAALVSTWFCGLLLTTPLYHPYPRLLFPWWMAATLLTAWFIHRRGKTIAISHGEPVPSVNRRQEHSRQVMLVVTVLLMAWYPENHLWENRRDLANAAVQIANELRSHSDNELIQVYGMPPVVLALRERGVAATLSGGPEQAAQGTGWLVVSSEADRYPAWTDPWPRVANHFELIRSIPTYPSSIARLDNGPLPPNPSPVEVRLYRRK